MGWIWANLDDKGKDEVQALEDKLGKRILAVYPDFKSTKVNDDELKQIQGLEEKLKVNLVAVVSH